MKRALAITLLLATCGLSTARAEPPNSSPLSIADMQKQLAAPRIFAVAAYVIRKDDECPRCPPQAVCETCVHGILIADRPDAPVADGLYLVTPQAAQFRLGSRYLFRIRYRVQRNAAGAWQREGPQLVDSSLAGKR